MSSTINFGIDLGTTNSLIAKCDNGVVDVFKNPVGHKETLPSVVGFRKERILVGDKAREYLEKDPGNVFSCFKRKMGTSESFFVPNLGDFRTPMQLSAMVLKELRNFIYTAESPQSVVITIPASFDTVQSNATKQAGYDAGFKEVVLLQEPIAASLAFANKGNDMEKEGRWLVYDLGGGTFDVALVQFRDGEMRITDHEGNNYLGGLDFDNLIVEELIVPYMQSQGHYTDLMNSLKSASGKRNALYYELVYKAEEAKIMLSNQQKAEIEFETEDDNGEEQELIMTISREVFNDIIRERIEETIEFAKMIIDRHSADGGKVKEVILIGGSTYIPLVRSMLQEGLGIPVNASVDPTTAVAIGAAYFAGTKTASYTIQSTLAANTDAKAEELQVKMAYQKNTNDREEYFSALITGDTDGRFYRITRDDGGFDSGLKPLAKRIEEVLTLLPNALNQFHLKFFDAEQMPLAVSISTISIVHGKYSLYGQPLPNDICLEVDDNLNHLTHLEVLFEKNEILPVKKTITKTISRTIVKGSTDQLLINVLEGSRYATAQSNLPIGVICINGKDIDRDLIKGSDVDLTIEITESRDIKINAYLSIADKEYAEVFSPTSRNINISRLKDETDYLLRIANKNMSKLVDAEDFEAGAKLRETIKQLEQILKRLRLLKEDDVTDEKYKLEEQKRRMALSIDMAGKDNRIRELREDYFGWKASTAHYLSRVDNEALLRKFGQITRDENEFLSGSEAIIKRRIEEMRQLSWDIRKKDIDYLAGLYMLYVIRDPEDYKDQNRLKLLIERGDAALQRKSTEELLAIIYQMYDLLINKETEEPLKGTGLS